MSQTVLSHGKYIPEQYKEEYELARLISSGWGIAEEQANFEAAFDPENCMRMLEAFGAALRKLDSLQR